MSDRNAGLQRTKDRLRAEMRAVRAAIPPEERVRLASLIEGRLVDLPEIREAGTILLFYSFGTEVETSGIARALHAGGKRLLLPYLDAAEMDAAEIAPDDELVPTSYGPKEPARRIAVDPGDVDAVVAPGLAFDRRGNRLGYGGGHYDRYLRRLGAGGVRAGIGFSAQVVEAVPAEPGDERLDVVVTDAETIPTVSGEGPTL